MFWSEIGQVWGEPGGTPPTIIHRRTPPPGWSVSGHSFLEISLCPVLSDTWMGKYSTFHPKHPKWDQNLQFKPKRETKSITVTFMWVPPVFSGLLTGKNISSCQVAGACSSLEYRNSPVKMSLQDLIFKSGNILNFIQLQHWIQSLNSTFNPF